MLCCAASKPVPVRKNSIETRSGAAFMLVHALAPPLRLMQCLPGLMIVGTAEAVAAV